MLATASFDNTLQVEGSVAVDDTRVLVDMSNHERNSSYAILCQSPSGAYSPDS